MNAHFVCVKVDREERPDLDDIYMAATLAMNQGQGGWPMTVFLTPGAGAVLRGHLLPARRPLRPARLPARCSTRDRRAVAHATARGCASRRAEVVEHLRAGRARPRPAAPWARRSCARRSRQLARDFDERFGGFGARAQVPALGRAAAAAARCTAGSATSARWRWRARRSTRWRAAACTTRWAAASTATRWTSAGWCRTSRRCCTTTRCWRAPTSRRYQATGDAFYARIAREVLDYVLREMTVARGRLLLRHRRRLRGRGGQVLRLDARARSRRSLGDAEAARRSARTTTSRRGQLGGPQHPQHLAHGRARGASPWASTPEELEAARRRRCGAQVYEARAAARAARRSTTRC